MPMSRAMAQAYKEKAKRTTDSAKKAYRKALKKRKEHYSDLHYKKDTNNK